VLLAILFHAGINFATWGSTLILPASADDPVVSMVLLVVAAIAAAVIVSGWVREPKRPPGGEGGLGSDVSGR
jgi:hypothetical protein